MFDLRYKLFTRQKVKVFYCKELFRCRRKRKTLFEKASEKLEKELDLEKLIKRMRKQKVLELVTFQKYQRKMLSFVNSGLIYENEKEKTDVKTLKKVEAFDLLFKYTDQKDKIIVNAILSNEAKPPEKVDFKQLFPQSNEIPLKTSSQFSRQTTMLKGIRTNKMQQSDRLKENEDDEFEKTL